MLLVALFWAALLFGFVMAVLPRPPELPGNPSDKVQHILAFTVLTSLALAAYPRARPLKIGLWLAAFGGLIELVQMIPALHRDGSWLDWAADIGAVAVVLLLGVPLRRYLMRRSGSAP
jgi:di/tricarboxylate transporter